jgi:hypothetical protein
MTQENQFYPQQPAQPAGYPQAPAYPQPVAYPQAPYPQAPYPQGAPAPANVLAYANMNAPPASVAGVWRDGALLVAPVIAELPDVCVKCGANAEGGRWRKKVYWHHPALYLLIFFPGILIYAIVALIVRKSATIGVGLCPRHRARRNRTVLATWLLGLGAAAGIVGGIAYAGNARGSAADYGVFIVLAGFVLIIAAAIVGSRARVLSPKKIDGPWAWYTGAGEDFLRVLPVVGQM